MKKKILILVNHEITIMKFRFELIERLIKEGHEIVISTPTGKNKKTLENLGCKVVGIGMDRHGINPIKDVKIVSIYYKLIKQENPDIILSYTIKPNIYGGIASRLLKVPFIPNITGLGNAVTNGGLLKKIIILLYRISMKKAQVIFVQNEDNKNFILQNNIGTDNVILLPGSGVNIEKFKYCQLEDSSVNTFLYRLSKISWGSQ